jgi:hypothetical protein
MPISSCIGCWTSSWHLSARPDQVDGSECAMLVYSLRVLSEHLPYFHPRGMAIQTVGSFEFSACTQAQHRLIVKCSAKTGGTGSSIGHDGIRAPASVLRSARARGACFSRRPLTDVVAVTRPGRATSARSRRSALLHSGLHPFGRELAGAYSGARAPQAAGQTISPSG